MQLKFEGGSAGHNGIASVIEHVGPKFWRLRFGVGHPRDAEHGQGGRRNVIDHVLKRASGNDEALLRENLRDAVDALPVLLEHGAERAKNLLHTRKPETK
jgi:PTH1 family peptidyl-tRNA hydrolase